MLRTVLGRYALFGVLGVEALLLPYFLSEQVYGEIEYYKFTGFLLQFMLLGASTGYVTLFLKKTPAPDQSTTRYFVTGAFLHIGLVSVVLFLLDYKLLALIGALTAFAMVVETLLKVRRQYLLAMSFKPILSVTVLASLPLVLHYELTATTLVLGAFLVATLVYTSLACLSVGRAVFSEVFQLPALKCFSGKAYFKNVREGILINASTAMTFLFFFTDRTMVRTHFNSSLADYSLSFSIAQLTMVAITTFSYVNIVEYGANTASHENLKQSIALSLKSVLQLYGAIGPITIGFSYFAESIYGYENVFETTLIMVSVLGLANVLNSISAAHLYLGGYRGLALLMAVSLGISVLLNSVVPLEGVWAYYLLLIKTYGLYLGFSAISALLVWYRLRRIEASPSVER